MFNLNFFIMAFELPKLRYSYDALEPYIDSMTMDIHYNKHHGAYTNNLNNAIKDTPPENLHNELFAKIPSIRRSSK